MSWLDDIQKDLEDSRNHPVRKKKDWEIVRDIRLKDQAKYASSLGASKGGKIGGATNRKTGHIQSLAGHAGKIAVQKRKERDMDKFLQDQSNAGKKGSKKAMESGKFGFYTTGECPHCKSNVRLTNLKRWHGDKCWAKGLDLDEIWNKFNEEKWSIEGLAKNLGVRKGPFRTWILSMKESTQKGGLV